jgi:glycosyltransferase involved in cell wall biosynthesis
MGPPTALEDVIASYGSRIVPVLKENGGQASAFNAGFEASHGQVIFFVDADDTLLPSAVELATTACLEPGVAKVHWPLWIVDDDGRRTESTYPDGPLPEGDLRDCVLRHGSTGYVWPMTSGNAWARSFVERVIPMPETHIAMPLKAIWPRWRRRSAR